MKKAIFLFALFCCNMCFSQSFSSVCVYIANPYVERMDVIKAQMYNADYVRSHYATRVVSIEQNYINSLYDSLQAFRLTDVAYDSVDMVLSPNWGGSVGMNFEPRIVIDFVRGSKYSTNEEVCTFAVDGNGYVYRTCPFASSTLFYPDRGLLDFLSRRFSGMFFLR